jgi:hypothetical protein
VRFSFYLSPLTLGRIRFALACLETSNSIFQHVTEAQSCARAADTQLCTRHVPQEADFIFKGFRKRVASQWRVPHECCIFSHLSPSPRTLHLMFKAPLLISRPCAKRRVNEVFTVRYYIIIPIFQLNSGPPASVPRTSSASLTHLGTGSLSKFWTSCERRIRLRFVTSCTTPLLTNSCSVLYCTLQLWSN